MYSLSAFFLSSKAKIGVVLVNYLSFPSQHILQRKRKLHDEREAYTLKVPETVSLAERTADSRSKLPMNAVLELSSDDFADAYEFQSASKEGVEEEACCCST